jgi:hypothetical protein
MATNQDKKISKNPRFGVQAGNSGGGRQEERWGGHSDRVEAKRAEIRGFTEKFIKDSPPNKDNSPDWRRIRCQS